MINAPSSIIASNPTLLRQYWNTVLVEESLFRDLYSKLRTPFDRVSNVPIPMDAITMEFGVESNPGYFSATIGFINALQNTPREGNAQPQILNEETFRQKHQTVHYNEFSHAVSTYGYGIDFNQEKVYYDSMAMATKLLGQYMEELGGLYYRQAFVQRRSRNLTRPPTSLAQGFNERIYVAGEDDANQPQYSLTLQTYTNRIAQACVNAGTSAVLGAKFLTWLRTKLVMDRVEPLMINGKKRWILTIGPYQVFHVHDLDDDKSVAKYWTSVSRMNELDRVLFPDLLGEWMNILLVEDERAPTLEIHGSNPFTLNVGYVHPGNNDQRGTSIGTRDIGTIHGRAPIIDWYPTKIHHEYDDYNYKKCIGNGAFGERGVQLRRYDDETASATTGEQRYCGLCLFARGTVQNH